MASERDQVGISLFDNFFGTIGFKSTCCNNVIFEHLTQPRLSHSSLPFCDEHIAFDPRFNDVEICAPEAIELFCEVIEECGWVAIRQGVPCSSRCNSHSDAIAVPDGYHCFDYFQQETRPIFDRPTICVGTPVATVLQLVG